jgi:formylmethanofuran dehydrogenase subunit E
MFKVKFVAASESEYSDDLTEHCKVCGKVVYVRSCSMRAKRDIGGLLVCRECFKNKKVNNKN